MDIIQILIFGEEYKYKVSHNEIKLYTSVFCICMKYLVSYTEGGT
jgi:hypothetical protein